jgi:hypothetical protein
MPLGIEMNIGNQLAEIGFVINYYSFEWIFKKPTRSFINFIERLCIAVKEVR